MTRGGDGGAAVPEAMLHGASFAHDRDNLRTVLVCDPARALVATADPYDVAHNQRDGTGVFYLEQGRRAPRRGLAGCPPRRYPASAIVSSGVSIDSMFDGLAARTARLERDGLAPQRAGAISTAAVAEQADARLLDGLRLRDVLHQRTRQELSPEEHALERQASAMLRGAR